MFSKSLNLINIVLHLSLWNYCDIPTLRLINFIGGFIVIPYLISKISNQDRSFSLNFTISPLFTIYYFLYYTDVWSLIFVLLSLYYIIQQPYGKSKSTVISSLTMISSLWFRQTNIIWCAVLVVIFVDRNARFEGKYNNRLPFIAHILGFIKQAFNDWKLLITLSSVFVTFVVFLVWNGGITLGDKSNHSVSLHFAQLYYCSLFITVFTWPIWFDFKILFKYLNKYYFSLGIFTTIFQFLILAITIKYGTIVHHFLLADNRHYAFYIWRKIIGRTPYMRYIMIPIYHFAVYSQLHFLNITNWQHKIINNKNSENLYTVDKIPDLVYDKDRFLVKASPLVSIAILIGTVLTIVPSPLFEPRYYMVPLALYRLYLSNIRTRQELFNRRLAEFTWNIILNVVIIGVFLTFSFEWTTEHAMQRIIW